MAARCLQRGFTLMELMVVFAIAALIVGVSVPFTARLFDTMQYRDAVRQISAAATSARYQAITSGQAVDLVLSPDSRSYSVNPAINSISLDRNQMETLADDLRMEVISAREVSPGGGLAAIRFYPQGSSTGGSVSVLRASGEGVRLRVDWLLGRVTQESLGVL